MKLLLTFLVVTNWFDYLEGVKFRCDYKFTNVGWFKYHVLPATWNDARLRCQLEGGVLASPISTDIKIVMKTFACKLDIFTGIHATFSKGQYHSIEGVALDEITYEWVGYEPDNKNNAESCIALDYSGKFSDVNCDEPRPYVCYREYSDLDINVCGTPDPEYHFDIRTNKCYKFHTKARTFARAHFACSVEGGHLAIINSIEEAKVIKEVFAKYPSGAILGSFWKDVAFIGFHTWNEGTDWRTIHGQSLEEAGFSKFSSGEPSNSSIGENCGSVYRNGLLNDVLCEKQYAFICEKKPDHPPICDSEHNHLNIPACDDSQRQKQEYNM